MTSDARPRHACLPPEFARLPMRMMRAASAAQVYAHPRPVLGRLTDLGLLHRVATGLYVAVPGHQVGTRLDAGFGGGGYRGFCARMGVSAARLHGVIPRALATAVVAVPTRHDPIRLADRQAVVRFVLRDTARLDAERIDTELGAVLVATAEQTVLDLVKLPGLGDAEGGGVAGGVNRMCWRRSPMLKNADDVDAAAGSVTEEPLMPAYSSVSSDGRARTGDQGWHVVRTSKSPNLDHVSTCRRHGL